MNTTFQFSPATNAVLINRQTTLAPKALPHSSKILFVIFALVTGLVMVNLFVSNSLATKGKLVTDLKIKGELLQKENIELKSRIASLGSLTEIEKKASSLGLEKNSSGKIFVKDPAYAYSR